MDKQKEIEEMAHTIKTAQGIGYYFPTKVALRIAKGLFEAGYGDVRYVVKDVLNKVFRYVEEARLECEFQDKDGKWFMDESEFMCEFTLGKLQELYREYGIEMFTGSEQTNNKKEVCGDEISKNDKA